MNGRELFRNYFKIKKGLDVASFVEETANTDFYHNGSFTFYYKDSEGKTQKAKGYYQDVLYFAINNRWL
jgi:hypothetical protein